MKQIQYNLFIFDWKVTKKDVKMKEPHKLPQNVHVHVQHQETSTLGWTKKLEPIYLTLTCTVIGQH